jgi:hypothetical protein
VIDYKSHTSLEVHLAEKFKSEPFDCIFDCIEPQALYSNSPKYLKEGRKFITIVGGRSQGIVPFLRNKCIPVFLGGTPRAFKLMGLAPAGQYAQQAMKWGEEGLVQEVPIDSEYPFEQVPEVSCPTCGYKHRTDNG